MIAASAGGLDPLRRIIAALPVPCTAAVFVVMHIGPYPSVLPHLLGGRHVATFAQDGTPIEAGHIYIAPPDHHMYLGISSIRLSQGPKLHHTRPAADPLFITAAEAHGQQVLGIVLSGGDGDGADGLRAIVEHGGTAFVQDPKKRQILPCQARPLRRIIPMAVYPLRKSRNASAVFAQGAAMTAPKSNNRYYGTFTPLQRGSTAARCAEVHIKCARKMS